MTPAQIPSSAVAGHPARAPLPALPYGAADGFTVPPHVFSEAISAVNQHCREVEWRRLALALQRLEAFSPPARSGGA